MVLRRGNPLLSSPLLSPHPASSSLHFCFLSVSFHFVTLNLSSCLSLSSLQILFLSLFDSFCLVRSVLMSPFDSFISLNLSSCLARAALIFFPSVSFLFLSPYFIKFSCPFCLLPVHFLVFHFSLIPSSYFFVFQFPSLLVSPFPSCSISSSILCLLASLFI